MPKPRARDFGVAPGFLEPGPLNAITDVSGVTVGHVTLTEGQARTGVTAVLPGPRDTLWRTARFGASTVLNGYGVVTGRDWLRESGLLGGPILSTSHFAVGTMLEGLNRMCLDPDAHGYTQHLVAETWDGWLNDPMSGLIKPEHAAQAIDAARGGPVDEGCVGGGTGMCAFDFKSGIGTASRVVPILGRSAMRSACWSSRTSAIGEQLVLDGMPLGRVLPHAVVPGAGAEAVGRRTRTARS
jgi:D-aminopeptidase